jgi:SAM-dependent methyltransferase
MGTIVARTSSTAQDQLRQVARDWTTLGESDPLWAVCVDPDRRGGRWDVGEFMSSGAAEVSDLMVRLDQLGICPRREAALDFGCGAGRLTGALRGHFAAVTGVDVSQPMLARAQDLLAGQSGCRFVHNDRADLAVFPDASFDLVYSGLVLQHMPSGLAEAYLAEFVRVVRPGGAVVVLVPEAHRRTPRGIFYACAPTGLIGLIQRSVFGYPAAMRMTTLPARRVQQLAGPLGASLVASDPRTGVGDHWQMACHFLSRYGPAVGPSAAGP